MMTCRMPVACNTRTVSRRQSVMCMASKDSPKVPATLGVAAGALLLANTMFAAPSALAIPPASPVMEIAASAEGINPDGPYGGPGLPSSAKGLKNAASDAKRALSSGFDADDVVEDAKEALSDAKSGIKKAAKKTVRQASRAGEVLDIDNSSSPQARGSKVGILLFGGGLAFLAYLARAPDGRKVVKRPRL